MKSKETAIKLTSKVLVEIEGFYADVYADSKRGAAIISIPFHVASHPEHPQEMVDEIVEAAKSEGGETE